MKDLNAKAPKTRKPEVSPLFGSIIKIASLLVIAALVVLVTLIIIRSLDKDEEESVLFSDRVVIGIEDYRILTRQDGTFDDISSQNVKKIIDELVDEGTHETTNYYFFFYYAENIDKLDADLKALVDSKEIDELAPIFIALLDGSEDFVNYLSNQEELQDLDIEDALVKRLNSVLIVYNFEADEQYQVYSRVSEQKNQLNNLVN